MFRDVTLNEYIQNEWYYAGGNRLNNGFSLVMVNKDGSLKRYSNVPLDKVMQYCDQAAENLHVLIIDQSTGASIWKHPYELKTLATLFNTMKASKDHDMEHKKCAAEKVDQSMQRTNGKTIKQLVAYWLNTKSGTSKAALYSYKHALSKFVAYLETEGVTSPTTDTYKQYRQNLFSSQAASSTISTELYILRYFFRWTAIKNHYPNITGGFTVTPTYISKTRTKFNKKNRRF
jgi:hypothetical protein